jgi:hypothetical protein
MAHTLRRDGRLVTKVSEAVRRRMTDLRPHQRYRWNPVDFVYQSCRFCRRSVHETVALWQYGVRHYVCDGCRAMILEHGWVWGRGTRPAVDSRDC